MCLAFCGRIYEKRLNDNQTNVFFRSVFLNENWNGLAESHGMSDMSYS